MDKPTLNIPLLRKTLEHITHHPDQHDQSLWWTRDSDCGTAACVAGWAVHFAGHTMETPPWPGVFIESTADGESIWEVAQHELGLTAEQAEDLFCAYNTVDLIWDLVSDYTHGEVCR